MGARELQALLREITRVQSPVQRMKLVALAWRTAARLTPAERTKLASTLGVRGFEHVLEGLGRGREGIAPAEVLRALDGAEHLDPSKLQRLVFGLRDPERRKELLMKGLEALDRIEDEPTEVVADEPAAEEAGPPEKVTELIIDPAATRSPTLASELGSGPEPEPGSGQEPEPEPEPAEPETEPAGPEPSSDRGRAPEDRTEPSKPPVEEREPEPEPADDGTETPSLIPSPEEAAVDPGGAREGAASLTTRFRHLRAALEEDGEWGMEEVRWWLSRFPEGWPRRRAVMSFLRRGRPARLDDALAVIEELPEPVHRRWACATLVDSRVLDDDEARRVIDRFPFPSLDRRLRRRSDRRRGRGAGSVETEFPPDEAT